jgi:hypothetical protein
MLKHVIFLFTKLTPSEEIKRRKEQKCDATSTLRGIFLVSWYMFMHLYFILFFVGVLHFVSNMVCGELCVPGLFWECGKALTCAFLLFFALFGGLSFFSISRCYGS